MTSWSIDSVATNTILDITEAEFWEFEQTAGVLGGDVDRVAGVLPGTQTAEALETFVTDPMLVGLTAAAERAYAAVRGTREAFLAYQNGQEDMAGELEIALDPYL